MDVERTLTEHYGLMGVDIPPLSSPKFGRFVSGMLGFAPDYLSNRALSFLSVKFQQSPAAYVAFNKDDRHSIAIPFWYMNKEAIAEYAPGAVGLKPELVATALINGSLIHEALHCKYTYDPSALDEKLPEQMFAILNVLEDIYIESQALEHHKKFLEAKNAMFFTEPALLASFEKFNEDPCLPNFLNVITKFKNAELRSHELADFMADWIVREAATRSVGGLGTFSWDPKTLFGRALDEQTPASRKRLAYRIYQMFKRADKLKPKDGEGEGAEGSEGEGSGTSTGDGEASEVMASMSKVVENAEASDGEEVKLTEAMKKAVSSLGEKLAKMRVDYMEKEFGSSEFCKIPGVQEVPLKKMLAGMRKDPFPLTRPDDESTFVRMLKAMKSENHTPGEPLKRGRKVVNTRISRIVTDGKIFSNPQTMETKQSQELIILLDASGSTDYYEDKKTGMSLFESEVTYAYYIFLAAREIGMPCAVFMHTSLHGREIPCFAEIASFGRPNSKNTKSPREAFASCARTYMSENFDGLIIRKLIKKFSVPKARKILLVLSDGAPSGPEYFGGESFKDTKAAIQEAREAGALVIALSLIEGVVSSNKSLYGEKFAIDASDNLVGKLRRLLVEYA